MGLPPVWLRDNCFDCRNPTNGQKLFGILDLPSDLRIDRVEESGETLTVVFAPDGHRSTFSRRWLAAQQYELEGDGRTEDEKELWQAADLAGQLPEAEWESYLGDASNLARVLQAVQRLGFAVLHGTPVAEGTVLEVARSFGYVRETNYGHLFDVRVEVDPSNLAFTGLAISPHTDTVIRVSDRGLTGSSIIGSGAIGSYSSAFAKQLNRLRGRGQPYEQGERQWLMGRQSSNFRTISRLSSLESSTLRLNSSSTY
ncbi:MAG: TauD/TfdA family dioxygenase [Acidimicrobiales bacterium]